MVGSSLSSKLHRVLVEYKREFRKNCGSHLDSSFRYLLLEVLPLLFNCKQQFLGRVDKLPMRFLRLRDHPLVVLNSFDLLRPQLLVVLQLHLEFVHLLLDGVVVLELVGKPAFDVIPVLFQAFNS